MARLLMHRRHRFLVRTLGKTEDLSRFWSPTFLGGAAEVCGGVPSSLSKTPISGGITPPWPFFPTALSPKGTPTRHAGPAPVLTSLPATGELRHAGPMDDQSEKAT